MAVLAQEKLGDAVLMLPFLSALRRAFPEAQVVVFTFGRNEEFFRQAVPWAMVIPLKPVSLKSYRRALGFRFDVVINTKDHPSFSFLLATLALRTRLRVGIAHELHEGFFDREVNGPFHRPMMEKYRDLFLLLAEPHAQKHWCLELPAIDPSPAIAQILPELERVKPVAINLSAGSTDREWSRGKWHQLLEQIDGPVIVLAVGRRLADKHILEKEVAPVFATPETRTLWDAAALLKCCRLLVSPDTSLIHVAGLLGIPVIGLYRADPDHFSRFAPWGPRAMAIVSATHRIEDIPVDKVVAELQRFISELD